MRAFRRYRAHLAARRWLAGDVKNMWCGGGPKVSQERCFVNRSFFFSCGLDRSLSQREIYAVCTTYAPGRRIITGDFRRRRRLRRSVSIWTSEGRKINNNNLYYIVRSRERRASRVGYVIDDGGGWARTKDLGEPIETPRLK